MYVVQTSNGETFIGHSLDSIQTYGKTWVVLSASGQIHRLNPSYIQSITKVQNEEE